MARVAIIGTGFVGRAWAITFARAGHEVALWDQAEDAASSRNRIHHICGAGSCDE